MYWTLKQICILTALLNLLAQQGSALQSTNENMVKILQPTFTKICDGLELAEGPVFDTSGNFYAVSPGSTPKNMSASTFIDGIGGGFHKINVTSGKKELICRPLVDGYGGRPAGCQSDKEDNIWIADIRLGILKYTPGSGCQQISKVDSDGNAMQGCNDLVFDSKGDLWVTAPSTKIAPTPEDMFAVAKNQTLGVLYHLGKGETIPTKIENETFYFCNGIAVKDDVLYVAETMTKRVIAFDITSPGKLSNRRVWAKLPKAEYDHPLGVGGPDGMDFDVLGRLLVAHHGGGHIEVFSIDGTLESRIKCPFKKPSNLHFMPKTRTCYVTEHNTGAVWKFEWQCEGMPMYSG